MVENVKVQQEVSTAEATPPITATPSPKEAVLVVKPTRGWSGVRLHELWDYRELIGYLVLREVKGRYRQMALGPLWLMIRPISTMIVFSIVFGGIARLPSDGIPYPIFTFVAIVPWIYFATATNASTGSLKGRMGVISKVYFPRLVVPISAVLAGLVDFVFASLVMLGLMAYYGIAPTVGALALPLYLMLAAATALGLGLWTAALEVRFRDLGMVVSHGLQAGMYLTPVAYAASLVPERYQTVYQLNPMYWVIEGFRWGLLGTGKGPETMMLIPIGVVIALLISGAFVFRKNERSVVDLL